MRHLSDINIINLSVNVSSKGNDRIDDSDTQGVRAKK